MARPALVALFCSAIAVCASAQTAPRTFVSTSGDNTNATALCPVTAPCRTFAAAIAVTSAGGEIVALASGGYGPFTIDRAVTVVSPLGVHAAIAAISGDAITVNAGTNDVVILRGLSLIGLGTATYGVRLVAGQTLYVENCVINGFTGVGVAVDRADASVLKLHVKDTTVRNVTSGTGIYMSNNGTGQVQATIDRCRIENNAVGIWASDNAHVSVTDSSASANGSAVVASPPNASATAALTLSRCVISHSSNAVTAGDFGFTPGGGASFISIDHSTCDDSQGYGVLASTHGTVLAKDTTATGCGTGFSVLSGSSLTMESCAAASNIVGASSQSSGAASTFVMTDCTLTQNSGFGLVLGSGQTVTSRGNNTIRGNAADIGGGGALVVVAGQ